MHRQIVAVMVALLPLVAAAAPESTSRKPKLAVTDVAVPGGDAALTTLLTEVALTEASASGHFSVIGQSDVVAILGHERKLRMLGCVERQVERGGCASDLAGALGADYLLVATVGALGGRWRLDVKLVDARRAAVVARQGEEVEPRADLLAAALQRGVRGVVALATAPAYTARHKAGWITAGAGAGCLVGSAVFALMTRAAWQDLRSAEAAGDAAAWDRARARVRTNARAADALLVAGLAGVGAGAWLALGDGGPKAAIAALPGGATLALGGSF